MGFGLWLIWVIAVVGWEDGVGWWANFNVRRLVHCHLVAEETKDTDLN